MKVLSKANEERLDALCEKWAVRIQYRLTARFEKALYQAATDHRWYSRWGKSWEQHHRDCEIAKWRHGDAMRHVDVWLAKVEAGKRVNS